MRRFRSVRPSPAMAVAMAALVFAMTGYAVAQGAPGVGNPNDEVEIETTTGGPVQTTDPSEEGNEVQIPLTDPTFTQKAGEVALVSVDADITGVPEQDASCDVLVSIVADPGPGDHDLGFELQQLAQRGDPTIKTADSQALPAPATDQEVTLDAVASELIPPDDQGDPAPDVGQCGGDQAFDVSLRVSITILR